MRKVFPLPHGKIVCYSVFCSVADPDQNPDPDPPDDMFLGLLDPDPDPLVRGMDPDPVLDPDPSISDENSRILIRIH